MARLNDRRNCAAALSSLAKLGNVAEPAIPKARQFLDDKDPKIRQHAAYFLFVMGDEQGIKLMRAKVISGNSAERQMFLDTISFLETEFELGLPERVLEQILEFLQLTIELDDPYVG